MKGFIRIVIGIVLTFGAVGTIEIDTSAPVFLSTLIALIGAAFLFSGVSALSEKHDY